MPKTPAHPGLEKGFRGTAETRGEKLAHAISVGASPLFTALPLFAAVALHTAPDLLHAVLWWSIVAVGITAIPYLFIRIGVRQGRYTDVHISNRAQRFIPLSFGLGCMLLVFVLLFILAVPLALLATVTAAMVSLALAIVITQLHFKISLHMVGITGAITICVVFFGPVLLVLIPLVPLVGWARWEVRAHTAVQVAVGTALAFGVTLLILWLFGQLW